MIDVYDPVDLVRVDLPQNKKMKLASEGEGPFIVVLKSLPSENTPVVYQVANLQDPIKPLRTLHCNRLKNHVLDPW